MKSRSQKRVLQEEESVRDLSHRWANVWFFDTMRFYENAAGLILTLKGTDICNESLTIEMGIFRMRILTDFLGKIQRENSDEIELARFDLRGNEIGVRGTEEGVYKVFRAVEKWIEKGQIRATDGGPRRIMGLVDPLGQLYPKPSPHPEIEAFQKRFGEETWHTANEMVEKGKDPVDIDSYILSRAQEARKIRRKMYAKLCHSRGDAKRRSAKRRGDVTYLYSIAS